MRRFLFIFSFLLLLFSCDNEAYEAGDGALSYMRADFVEAETDASARFVTILTDDGERFELVPPVSCKWAETPDSVYRALCYYNKVEQSDGVVDVRPITFSQVLTPPIRTVGEYEGRPATDPVTLVSAWRSANGKYLNFELSVKTGQSEAEDVKHKIGLVYEGTGFKPDGGRCIELLLTHERNGIPEYYSVTAYVSIPLNKLMGGISAGDDVVVSVNTYGGIDKKTFHF